MKKLLLLTILLIPTICFATKWESVIESGWSTNCLYRLYVPHGWIIGGCGANNSVSFYPAENHEWKI